jgi:hypothetical protein
MALRQQIQEIKETLSVTNQVIAHFADHQLTAIENFEETHRQLIASLAVGGDKINGILEKEFYQTIAALKMQLVETLRLTAEDINHQGDKNWVKNFKDGVL